MYNMCVLVVVVVVNLYQVVVVGVNVSRTEVVDGSTVVVIVDGDDRVVEWCSEDL